MRFVDLFDLTRAIELDELVDDCRQASIISKMDDPAVALKVMKSGLWYSYMFNRYAVPLYASHVFRAISSFDRVDDPLGTILAGVMGAVKGELFNNNIYGQPSKML